MTYQLAIGVVDTDTVVLAFVLAAAGLLLIGGGWFGLIPSFASDKNDADDEPGKVEAARDGAIRLVSAGVGFILLFMLSGWPVLALFGGAAGWSALTLKTAKRERRLAIERVDAIATWVETVRDNISGAAGLSQALRGSGVNAPEAIRVEVRDLVLRLQHESLVSSLRLFAKDLAHPTADMAVGSLILASTRSAGSLSEILANTSQAARDSASMMRNVEAGRVQSQAQAKMVGIIAGGMSLLMITSDGKFVEPYGTVLGQIVLFFICCVAAGSSVAMYRLGKAVTPTRVFRGVEREPEAPSIDLVEVN